MDFTMLPGDTLRTQGITISKKAFLQLEKQCIEYWVAHNRQRLKIDH